MGETEQTGHKYNNDDDHARANSPAIFKFEFFQQGTSDFMFTTTAAVLCKCTHVFYVQVTVQGFELGTRNP